VSALSYVPASSCITPLQQLTLNMRPTPVSMPAGSIVALFLALAAIQFVVDQDVPASSYITPLQQLTLTSYLSLILVGFECVIIWYLTTYHVEKVK
jgi:hypothetical protein